MAYRLIIVASAVVVSASLAVPVSTGVVESRPAPARAALTKITEFRQATIIEPEEKAFSMDKPGLKLTFDLAVPEGRTLLGIGQPTRETVQATDSAGTDLSAIEPGFMDELEFVELMQVYGEAPTGFDFQLALPARQATTFSLRTRLDVTTYRATRTVPVAVSTKWTDLDSALFNGTPAKVRLEKQADGVHLEVRPGTVKDAIEDVQLFRGDEALDTSFTMWNDSGIAYAFMGAFAESMTAKITIRVGLETHEVPITITNQPLP